MQLREVDLVMGAAASTAQNLPYDVVRVVSAASLGALGAAGDTETALTVITTGTASGNDLLFQGTPQAPAKAFTLGTAAASEQVLKIRAVVAGDLPAYL